MSSLVLNGTIGTIFALTFKLYLPSPLFMVKVVIEFDLDKAKDRRVYRRVTKSLTPYRGKEIENNIRDEGRRT